MSELDRQQQTSAAEPASPRRAWVSPEVADLPRLTELTLQTGDSIEGMGGLSGGSGGSTVF